MKKKTTMTIEIEYDDRKTDPEGLAEAMDKMWKATFEHLYGPDCLKDYGNPKFGKFFPPQLNGPVPLPRNFAVDEKGNTLLVSPEGNMVAWLKLGDGLFLKISYTPANDPALLVNIKEQSEKEIAAFINKELSGWSIYNHACNIKGVKTRRIDRFHYDEVK